MDERANIDDAHLAISDDEHASEHNALIEHAPGLITPAETVMAAKEASDDAAGLMRTEVHARDAAPAREADAEIVAV